MSKPNSSGIAIDGPLRGREGTQPASRQVSFTSLAIRLGPSESFVLISARVNERRPGLRILRTASQLGEEGSILVSPPGRSPAEATISPPRPFRGGAELLDESGVPASWTGSLAIRMPVPPIPRDPIPPRLRSALLKARF